MNPDAWKTILETVVKPQARVLAVTLHELLAVNTSDGMKDALEAFGNDELSVLWEDVALPAMKREVFATLARLCSDSADGWEHVYRQGYKEHLS